MNDLYFYFGGYLTGLLVGFLLAKRRYVIKYDQ